MSDACAAHRETFDRVVLDARMPALGGCEALQGMCVLRPGTPAILTGGYLPAPHLSRLGGGVHFLPRPCHPGDLLDLVQQVVGAGDG